jgi:hypothetical protein
LGLRGTKKQRERRRTALKIVLSVEAFPGIGAASVHTAGREANGALDALRGEVTLVVAGRRAVVEEATLAVTLFQGPLADARVGLEERVGGIPERVVRLGTTDSESVSRRYSPVLAVKVAGKEEAALGDGKSREVARLGALKETKKGALLELSGRLSDGLSDSRREESGGKESCEDDLHD